MYKYDAIAKLDKELSEIKLPNDRKEFTVIKAIKTPVADALKNFCSQDEEFAQAVVQGETLSDCLAKIVKEFARNKYAMSDLETFKKAANFYFPTADIEFVMKINLCGAVEKKDEQPIQEHKARSIELSFDDLF